MQVPRPCITHMRTTGSTHIQHTMVLDLEVWFSRVDCTVVGMRQLSPSAPTPPIIVCPVTIITCTTSVYDVSKVIKLIK